MGESQEHKKIKEKIHDYFLKNLGPSLNEYLDEGDRVDIMGYNINGVKVRIEIIWSPSLFWYDMANILGSMAKIKIAIFNPKIINNSKYYRYFKRRVLSERNKGYILLPHLYDGSKILNNQDDVLENIFSDLKLNLENIKSEGYRDLTKDQLEFKLTLDTMLENASNYLINHNSAEFEKEIDNMIMIFNKKIKNWDAISIKYGVKQIFQQFYTYSNNIINELFFIFSDLFDSAYNERKHLLGLMIQELFYIIINSWFQHNINRGEQASKILLRLGMKYTNIDIAITEDCYKSIDAMAGDFFVPEIFSKQIIFCSHLYENKNNNVEIERLFNESLYDIQQNDNLSWDAGTFTYLIDSIEYAESEKNVYSIDISNVKKEYLLPILQQNIDLNIDFSDILAKALDEGQDDVKFPAELISKTIRSYKKFRQNIPFEIQSHILKTKNEHVIKFFNEIIDSDTYLVSIYK